MLDGCFWRGLSHWGTSSLFLFFKDFLLALSARSISEHTCYLPRIRDRLLKFHFLHRIPVLFALLFFWVFEIQLLMQIIINRIFVVAENRKLVIRVKWITAAVITLINISVFCIWIPAHLNPPVSQGCVCWQLLKSIAPVAVCLTDPLSATSWPTSTGIERQRFLFA